MFATLLGGLPRPPLAEPAGSGSSDPVAIDALVARVVEAQESAGLEPLTDGRLRWRGFVGPMAGLEGLATTDGDGGGGLPRTARSLPRWAGPLTVDAWRFATRATSRAVKQALPGPFTLGRRVVPGRIGRSRSADMPARAALTMAFAEALRAEILALVEAGCPLVEIEERDAHLVETDAERRLFREAHLALIGGIGGVHLSLAIIGGSADGAGIETILAAPYASLAVDLVDGPDNWRLVRAVPGDRGIVAGALSTRHPADDGPELLLWAAGYAASSNSRGSDRVGLATSGSLAGLSWNLAERKLRCLGEAARLAALPPAEAAASLDPRAIDIRSAAAGRYVRRPTRRT